MHVHLEAWWMCEDRRPHAQAPVGGGGDEGRERRSEGTKEEHRLDRGRTLGGLLGVGRRWWGG